jgi:hypothetical protein
MYRVQSAGCLFAREEVILYPEFEEHLTQRVQVAASFIERRPELREVTVLMSAVAD